MGRCDGRVALVTGAAGKGMGRSIALTLAREGARVVVNYRTSEASALAIVARIRDRGGEAIAVRADVGETPDCRALVGATIAAFGRLDICIVGPGGGWHPEPPEALDVDGALDDARRELAPLYNLMPLVLPGMYAQRWGRLIGIALRRPHDSPAYAYNVGKGARTEGLLLAAPAAWRHGVTVNVMAPGPVDGVASLEEAVELCDHAATWELRTSTTPQDVAEGVAFLCSDAARFVTGCELPYR